MNNETIFLGDLEKPTDMTTESSVGERSHISWKHSRDGNGDLIFFFGFFDVSIAWKCQRNDFQFDQDCKNTSEEREEYTDPFHLPTPAFRRKGSAFTFERVLICREARLDRVRVCVCVCVCVPVCVHYVQGSSRCFRLWKITPCLSEDTSWQMAD